MSLMLEQFEVGDKVYPVLTEHLWANESPVYGIVKGMSKDKDIVRISPSHKTDPCRLSETSKNSYHKKFWTKIPTKEQVEREQAVEKQRSKNPMVWLDVPDLSESGGINVEIKTISISDITEIAWSVSSIRKSIETLFLRDKKLPLILIEHTSKGEYELHDGQHRLAAYRNVFPYNETIKAAIFDCKS